MLSRLRSTQVAQVPIVHLDSFSRSGETLLLRALAAHRRIEVVHQVAEPDDPRDMQLFRALMVRKEPWIESSDPLVAHRRLDSSSVLVLKNAVWLHEYPRAGVILIRNPFSVMKSARVIGPESEGSLASHERQRERWGEGIDKNLLPHLREADNLSAFCVLYSRKMIASFMTGMPIVHYETLVRNPKETLKSVMKALDLEWDPAVLSSHERYEPGILGHGKIKLWLPIHSKSVESYKSVGVEAFDRIYAMTAPVLDLYGYEVQGRRVQIRKGYDARCSPGSARVVRGAHASPPSRQDG